MERLIRDRWLSCRRRSSRAALITASFPRQTSKRRLILSETITTASGLQYIDIVVGEGAEAKGGEKVAVHYTGWLYNNREKGKKFDSSVDKGEPLSFAVGAGEVINVLSIPGTTSGNQPPQEPKRISSSERNWTIFP